MTTDPTTPSGLDPDDRDVVALLAQIRAELSPSSRVVDSVHRVVSHEPTPPTPVSQHLRYLEAATPPVPVVVAVPTPLQVHGANVGAGRGGVQ